MSLSKRGGAGFIYILKSSVTIGGKEVIKIGMTTRTVDQRVRELKTGSVGGFEIAYSLGVENARELERRLHAIFWDSRVLSGGGQEFFHVPADRVIAEVERIATEVSRQRARTAWAKEMHDFRIEIGATQLANRIAAPIVILGIACWLLLIWAAHSTGQVSATLTAVLIAPIPLAYGVNWLVEDFMIYYFEPRFGAAIRAKHEELNAKYPLAEIPAGRWRPGATQ
jgi:hypothetical protein